MIFRNRFWPLLAHSNIQTRAPYSFQGNSRIVLKSAFEWVHLLQFNAIRRLLIVKTKGDLLNVSCERKVCFFWLLIYFSKFYHIHLYNTALLTNNSHLRRNHTGTCTQGWVLPYHFLEQPQNIHQTKPDWDDGSRYKILKSRFSKPLNQKINCYWRNLSVFNITHPICWRQKTLYKIMIHYRLNQQLIWRM